jgi:hypothetical protein
MTRRGKVEEDCVEKRRKEGRNDGWTGRSEPSCAPTVCHETLKKK